MRRKLLMEEDDGTIFYESRTEAFGRGFEESCGMAFKFMIAVILILLLWVVC